MLGILWSSQFKLIVIVCFNADAKKISWAASLWLECRKIFFISDTVFCYFFILYVYRYYVSIRLGLCCMRFS